MRVVTSIKNKCTYTIPVSIPNIKTLLFISFPVWLLEISERFMFIKGNSGRRAVRLNDKMFNAWLFAIFGLRLAISMTLWLAELVQAARC